MEEFSSFPDPIIENNFKTIYSPSDDTYLLIDYFKRNFTLQHFDGIKLTKIKRILDIGTGTGIIAIFLQKLSETIKNFNPEIYASDISHEALSCAKKNEELNKIYGKIQYIQSDLFNSFPDELENHFDIIIFNPPYLPSIKYQELNKEQLNRDLCWNGGFKGYDLILRFIHQFKRYINLQSPSYGYYISSSLTNLDKLYRIIEGYNLTNEILVKKHIFFEDIILNRVKLL